jgi:hypothetical protein
MTSAVKARTIARIHGVARYRTYKALSEQIARTVPAGASAPLLITAMNCQ